METRDINMNNADEVWHEINRLEHLYTNLSAKKYNGFEGEMVDADLTAIKTRINELFDVLDKLTHDDGGYDEASDPVTDLIAMDKEFNDQ